MFELKSKYSCGEMEMFDINIVQRFQYLTTYHCSKVSKHYKELVLGACTIHTWSLCYLEYQPRQFNVAWSVLDLRLTPALIVSHILDLTTLHDHFIYKKKPNTVQEFFIIWNNFLKHFKKGVSRTWFLLQKKTFESTCLSFYCLPKLAIIQNFQDIHMQWPNKVTLYKQNFSEWMSQPARPSLL